MPKRQPRQYFLSSAFNEQTAFSKIRCLSDLGKLILEAEYIVCSHNIGSLVEFDGCVKKIERIGTALRTIFPALTLKLGNTEPACACRFFAVDL